MNEYGFNDLEIGHKESFAVAITDDCFQSFQRISGDTNPLHSIDEYARENGFKEKVAFGLMTTCFLSRLVGVYLPGKECLLREVSVKYKNPVYVGDQLFVEGVVIDKNQTVGIMELSVIIRNQNKLVVLKGNIKVGFLNHKGEIK